MLPAVEHQYDGLQETSLRVESEPQLTISIASSESSTQSGQVAAWIEFLGQHIMLER